MIRNRTQFRELTEETITYLKKWNTKQLIHYIILIHMKDHFDNKLSYYNSLIYNKNKEFFSITCPNIFIITNKKIKLF